jgi:hypothetical protein
MKIKEGVRFATVLQKPMYEAMDIASEVWSNNGQELVITAALDGVHMKGSKHYEGNALDFRTRYFDSETKEKVANELRTKLPEAYDVIVHTTHIHVEYDPK